MAGTVGGEPLAPALRVTEQAEQTSRVIMAFEKEVMNSSAWRNKHKPLFQETLMERRKAVEVENANPPWSACEWRIIKKMEIFLEQSERI